MSNWNEISQNVIKFWNHDDWGRFKGNLVVQTYDDPAQPAAILAAFEFLYEHSTSFSDAVDDWIQDNPGKKINFGAPSVAERAKGSGAASNTFNYGD